MRDPPSWAKEMQQMYYDQSTALLEADRAFAVQDGQSMRYEELLSYVRNLKKKIAKTPAGEYKEELKNQLDTAKRDLHWLMLSL